MAIGDSGTPRTISGAELLWQAPTPPSRGPRPGLSLDTIARTAIEIADREGLDALSMQRIAGRLDYTAMSLYRYVPGKEQLLDVMFDVAVGQPPSFDDAGDWRSNVTRWVRAILEVYERHPWLLRVTSTTPPLGPNQLTWLDALLGLLVELELTAGEKIHVATFIASVVRDLARTTGELGSASRQSGVSVEQMGQGYAQAMADFVDAERFPALAKVVATGVFEPNELPYHDVSPSLDFGLQRLFDGIEGYLRDRSS